jgi:nicotinamide-nucleotide amidase
MTIPGDEQLLTLARTVATALRAGELRMATAESCTGGFIAKLLTDLPGSSVWFERGLVTYSNDAKTELLGVPANVLDHAGAVSAATVLAMAEGLLSRAPVQWTLAVSGIAGPDGGSADKPVGTVWIAWAGRGVAASASRFQFPGDRDAVRRATAAAALQGLADLLQPIPPPASER